MNRKIVDSNAMQAELPRSYLSSSARNYAVFNDYASMEAYKGNTLTSIYRSMEIGSEFPRQVIVLKPMVGSAPFLDETRVCSAE